MSKYRLNPEWNGFVYWGTVDTILLRVPTSASQGASTQNSVIPDVVVNTINFLNELAQK